MDNQTYSGGSWTMIPSMSTHSNASTPSSNQDQQFYLNQQQQFHHHQQQQQQQQQQQRVVPYQQQQLQQQQQQQQQQSLASHFNLLHLVENLADAVENGTRDQHTDALINELSNHFEKCQQLLNSIAASINDKSATVEGQKKKLEETEQMLVQRRELMAKYRNSVEELLKSEP